MGSERAYHPAVGLLLGVAALAGTLYVLGSLQEHKKQVRMNTIPLASYLSYDEIRPGDPL